MRSMHFTRPEAALQHAQELIKLGKPKDALQSLHDMIKDRRHKLWTPTHEIIMLKYVELCVELKHSAYAKDGLYQYKALTQQINPQSLEKIVTKYLELAAKRAEEARKASVERVEEIDDLDAGDAPENLLLSVVSGAATQDRVDRAVLSPWLRFVWDSYRNCLELCRNNQLVERLYHDVAEQSFNFCVKYQRRNEFRKLCDLLRLHLTQIQKSQGQSNPNAVKLTNSDSLSFIQETRLHQLDTAIQMELWQEAYKSAEDLHAVINISKEQLKKAQKLQTIEATKESVYEKMLQRKKKVESYDKLALTFWRSGNTLFHAAALVRKFGGYRDLKKSFTDEEEQATRVLLAVSCIVEGVEHPSALTKILDIEEMHLNNIRNHSNLLELNFAPTKEGILKEIARVGVPEAANEHVARLHKALEAEFNPLRIAQEVEQCLAGVEALGRPELAQYAEPIKLAAATKVIKQLAVTHDAMSLERLAEVIPFFERMQLERLIVDVCKHFQIKAHLDHLAGCILFEQSASGISGASDKGYETGVVSVRDQLESLHSSLWCSFIGIEGQALTEKALSKIRHHVQRYETRRDVDYEEMLMRRKKIESYKETNEKMRQDKAHQAQVEAGRKEEMRRQEEMRKLEEENRQKERLRKKAEQEEVQRKIMQEKLRHYQQNPLFQQMVKERGGEMPQDIDPEIFLTEQRRRLDQERKEQQTRLQQQEKRFDYMVRAFHIEEMQTRQRVSNERREAAPALHEISEEARIANEIKDRKKAEQAYEHLKEAHGDAAAFLASVISSKAEDLKKQRECWEQRLKEACDEEEARREREARRKADEEERRKLAEEEAARKMAHEEERRRTEELEKRAKEKMRDKLRDEPSIRSSGPAQAGSVPREELAPPSKGGVYKPPQPTAGATVPGGAAAGRGPPSTYVPPSRRGQISSAVPQKNPPPMQPKKLESEATSWRK